MSHLYEVLARRVDKWRADGYPAADFPAVGEILEWAAPTPAQLSFAIFASTTTTWLSSTSRRSSLACEHIGMTRTRTDRYFDGTFGKKLVKIVPFNHPLTLLDLEEVKRELDARPGEDRDVVT